MKLLCAVILVGTATIGVAQQPAQAPPKPLVDADHKRMQPEEAPTGSLPVVGDPAKPGMYVVRTTTIRIGTSP